MCAVERQNKIQTQKLEVPEANYSLQGPNLSPNLLPSRGPQGGRHHIGHTCPTILGPTRQKASQWRDAPSRLGVATTAGTMQPEQDAEPCGTTGAHLFVPFTHPPVVLVI